MCIIILNMGIKKSTTTLHSQQQENPSLRGTGLGDVLFTTTQQRVYALIFGQPDRSFYVNQIISLTGAGRGAIQRELARLAKSRLANVSWLGNQKRYQANKESPVYHELCSIVEKTVGLEDPIRAALEPLSDKIDLALLYGSVANRTDRATSDVDLMLVASDPSLISIYETMAPVEKKLDRRINPVLYRPADFQERRTRKGEFVDRVLNRPHIILMGTLDDSQGT